MIKFGTGGFRGIIGEDFIKENLQRIALGLTSLYKKEKKTSPIVIGYDFRFLSLEAARWMAEIFASEGIKVLISKGAVPTPAILYKTKAIGNDYSIMITASHNPYDNNGVKLIQKGGQDASKELTDRLEKEIANIRCEIPSFSFQRGLENKMIEEIDVLQDYLSYVRSFLHVDDTKKSIKVLIDPFYGTGVLTLKPILESMGFINVDVIHGERDAFFGGLTPNPTLENMKQDALLMKKGGYDICLGTDSDCDRLAILDEKGNYVDAHAILAMIDYYLVKYRKEKGSVVKNEATSHFIDNVAKRFNQECFTVEVGFKNVSQKMLQEDALLGGEGSGGLTVRGYLLGKDSTFSSALFLEMVSMMKKSVSEIENEVAEFSNYHARFYEEAFCYSADKNDLFSLFHRILPIAESYRKYLDHIEYNAKSILVHFSNGLGKVLIRFSGTEKVIRYYMETNLSEAEFEKNFNAFKKAIIEFETMC